MRRICKEKKKEKKKKKTEIHLTLYAYNKSKGTEIILCCFVCENVRADLFDGDVRFNSYKFRKDQFLWCFNLSTMKLTFASLYRQMFV